MHLSFGLYRYWWSTEVAGQSANTPTHSHLKKARSREKWGMNVEMVGVQQSMGLLRWVNYLPATLDKRLKPTSGWSLLYYTFIVIRDAVCKVCLSVSLHSAPLAVVQWLPNVVGPQVGSGCVRLHIAIDSLCKASHISFHMPGCTNICKLYTLAYEHFAGMHHTIGGNCLLYCSHKVCAHVSTICHAFTACSISCVSLDTVEARWLLHIFLQLIPHAYCIILYSWSLMMWNTPAMASLPPSCWKGQYLTWDIPQPLHVLLHTERNWGRWEDQCGYIWTWMEQARSCHSCVKHMRRQIANSWMEARMVS